MKTDLDLDLPIAIKNKRKLRKALEDVRKAHPRKLLLANDVVEASRDESSVFYPYMEWTDDAKMANCYRLVVARTLIRKVTIVLPDDPTESETPRYLSLRVDRRLKGGGYREVGTVVSNKELMAELEATAIKDYEAVSARYRMLTDLVARVKKALYKRKR